MNKISNLLLAQTRFNSKLATINIFKEDIKFSSAHFTIFSQTERERLHGHNYHVSVSITGFVDFNGLTSNYKHIKDLLRQVCKEYDEMVLIPTKSPFLKVCQEDKSISVIFNDDVMTFPKNDVLMLPITNVSGEELSLLISERLKIDLNGNFTKINVTVSSGAGQSISTQTENKKQLVITGGSSGIGKAIIEEFISQGYSAINISRRPVLMENVTNCLVDLCNPLEVSKIKDLNVSGQICLVHAAGVHPSDSINAMDSNQLLETMNVNVAAPAIISSHIAAKMTPGSSILFIGSTLSEKAVSNRLSYVTSKHALIGMMRSMTQDLQGRGIHSCVVCPGFTDTPMLRSAVGTNQEGFEKFIKDFVLFERLIQPEEIAKLVYNVANTPIVNGSVIHANLGQKEK